MEKPPLLKALKFPGFISVKNVPPPPSVSRGEKDSAKIKQLLKAVESCQCVDVVEYLFEVNGLGQALFLIKRAGDSLDKFSGQFETYPYLNQELDRLKLNTLKSYNAIDSIKRDLVKKYTGMVTGPNDTSQVIMNYYTSVWEKLQNSFDDKFSQATEKVIREAGLLAAAYQPSFSEMEKKLCSINDTCSASYDSLLAQVKKRKSCVTRVQSFIREIREDLNAADASLKEMKAALMDTKIYSVQQNYVLL